MSNQVPTVVFVCLHGSAKSVIAAEHFRRLAAQRRLNADAVATGTEPDAKIPEAVVQGLHQDGIDVRGRIPRKVSRAELETASRVVTFGCDVSALTAPDMTVERWDDVPPVSEDFVKARDAIVSRLPRLLEDFQSLRHRGPS